MTSNLNINNNFQYPNLPVSIIWPENPDDTPWFMMRLYEQLAYAINSKDNGIFTMAISNSATLIPNINNFGSYLVNISGSGPYVDPTTGDINFWPASIFQLTKSTPNNIGLFTETQTQAGTGTQLSGAGYMISLQQIPASIGPYYYFIQHNIAGVTGSFNVNIQGTQ